MDVDDQPADAQIDPKKFCVIEIECYTFESSRNFDIIFGMPNSRIENFWRTYIVSRAVQA